jgi:putative membrane protein
MKKTNSVDLSIREHLAKERTLLAADRTLLAYIRTAMTVSLVGISFFKLFNNKTVQLAGVSIMILACFFLLKGVYDVLKQRNKVEHIHLIDED